MNAAKFLNNMSDNARDDLKQWLAERVESVKSIDDVETSWNPIKTTINVLVARKTHKLLSDLLAEVVTFHKPGEKPKQENQFSVYPTRGKK